MRCDGSYKRWSGTLRPPGRAQARRHAGAAAVVTGTSAGAIAYAQQSQPVTNNGEARYHTVASLACGDNFDSTTNAAAGTPRSGAQVNRAVNVCAAMRQSFLLPGAAGIARPRDTTERHRVPPLTLASCQTVLPRCSQGPRTRGQAWPARATRQ